MAPPLKAPSLCIYLGNLGAKVNERLLKELGIQAGEVVSVRVQQQEASNNRFGFITFAGLDDAITFIGLFRGVLNLYGQPVTVNFANQEVHSDDITEDQAKRLETVKALLAATEGAGGSGAVRRYPHHAAHRYQPYGRPDHEPTQDSHSQQKQQKQAPYSSTYVMDQGLDYDHRPGRQQGSYQQHSAATQPAPVPVDDWQTKAAAAAAAAATQASLRLEQDGAVFQTSNLAPHQQLDPQHGYQQQQAVEAAPPGAAEYAPYYVQQPTNAAAAAGVPYHHQQAATAAAPQQAYYQYAQQAAAVPAAAAAPLTVPSLSVPAAAAAAAAPLVAPAVGGYQYSAPRPMLNMYSQQQQQPQQPAQPQPAQQVQYQYQAYQQYAPYQPQPAQAQDLYAQSAVSSALQYSYQQPQQQQQLLLQLAPGASQAAAYQIASTAVASQPQVQYTVQPAQQQQYYYYQL